MTLDSDLDESTSHLLKLTRDISLLSPEAVQWGHCWQHVSLSIVCLHFKTNLAHSRVLCFTFVTQSQVVGQELVVAKSTPVLLKFALCQLGTFVCCTLELIVSQMNNCNSWHTLSLIIVAQNKVHVEKASVQRQHPLEQWKTIGARWKKNIEVISKWTIVWAVWVSHSRCLRQVVRISGAQFCTFIFSCFVAFSAKKCACLICVLVEAVLGHSFQWWIGVRQQHSLCPLLTWTKNGARWHWSSVSWATVTLV